MGQKTHVMHGRDHLPRGADPIPGLIMAPGGDTLDEVILGLTPDGFWKLNESSGSVAADSSGFGQDMSTTTPEVNPNWGQPAGPPGEQTADFEVGTAGLGGTASRVSRAWPVIDGDFTAGLWVNRNDTDHTPLMGQGAPERSGGTGWDLGIASDAEIPADNKPFAFMKGSTAVRALNPLTPGTWAFIAMTYDATAGTYKLYINGLLQGTSAAFTFAPVTSAPLWIGHDGGLGGNAIQPCHCLLSYAFLVNRVLTGSELVTISDTAEGIVTSTAGQVPISDGAGGSTWGYVDTDSLADEAVTPDKIEPGTDGYTLQTVAGEVVWAAAAAGTSDPAADTLVWMPLTTVTGGVPELVWEADDSLIPTLTPL